MAMFSFTSHFLLLSSRSLLLLSCNFDGLADGSQRRRRAARRARRQALPPRAQEYPVVGRRQGAVLGRGTKEEEGEQVSCRRRRRRPSIGDFLFLLTTLSLHLKTLLKSLQAEKLRGQFEANKNVRACWRSVEKTRERREKRERRESRNGEKRRKTQPQPRPRKKKNTTGRRRHGLGPAEARQGRARGQVPPGSLHRPLPARRDAVRAEPACLSRIAPAARLWPGRTLSFSLSSLFPVFRV